MALVKSKPPLTSKIFVASVRPVRERGRQVGMYDGVIGDRGRATDDAQWMALALDCVIPAICGCDAVETAVRLPVAGLNRQRRPLVSCGVMLVKFPLVMAAPLNNAKLWPSAGLPARLLTMSEPL